MGFNKSWWLRGKSRLIFLMVFVTACGTGAGEKEYMDRARGYVETRDFNAATIELKNVLLENTKNAEARFMLGQIYLNLGDLKSADKELHRALNAGWDEAVVQLALAEVLYRLGAFQKVVDDIPIKENFPDNVRADLMGLLAASQSGLNKWDDAEQTLKTGELITGDSLWLSLSKIRLSLYAKDRQKAEQVLEQALIAHPESRDLWLLSAGLAGEGGEHEKAGAALKKVIELDPPRNITAWGRKARLTQSQIWLQQQDYAKAQEYINPVVKAFPGDPLANYLAGLVAFKQEQYDLAEESLLKVLRVAPEHRPSLMLFGALNFARKDYQQAAYYLEKAADSQPHEINAQTLLGRTYLMLGQFSEAEERLQLASSLVDDNAELLALVGVSRLKGGKTQAGIKDLQNAAAVAPENITIRGELARAYVTTGETGRAIKELESALKGNGKQHQTKALLLMVYLRAGEFDKALALADKLFVQLPDNPLPHNFTAAAQAGKKKFAAARSSYDKALQIESDNAMALLGLARLELLVGDVEAARKRFQSILDKQPNNLEALVAISKMYAIEGNTEQTLELLEKARKSNPKAIEPRLILANYYLNKNAITKAQEYVSEAQKLAPQDPRIMMIMGQVQIGMGEPEALQTFNKLVKRLPDSPDAHYFYALAKEKSGDLAGARLSQQKVLKLKPDYLRASYALANIALGMGKAEEALKIAQKLKARHPEAMGAYLLEGDALMAQKKYRKALSVYESVPGREQIGEVAARIYKAHRANNNDAAGFKVLHQWLDKHPDDLKVRGILAMSFLADGLEDDAITQYEFMLKKQPDNAAVLNDLSWLYNKKGKSGALEMAERAHRLAPNSAAIQDTYGWILVQEGRVESGLVVLEQSAKKLSDVPSVRYHLATALSRVGEKARAKKILESILAKNKSFTERDDAKALLKQLK